MLNLLKHLFQALSHIVQVLETDCFLIWDSKWRPGFRPKPPNQDQLRQWANNTNLFNNILFCWFWGFKPQWIQKQSNKQKHHHNITVFFAKNSRNVNLSAPLNLIFFCEQYRKIKLKCATVLFSFRFSQVPQYHSTLWAWASLQSPREALSSEVISSGNVSSSPGRTKQICIHFTNKHRWKSLWALLKCSHPPGLLSCPAPVWVFFLQCGAWRPLWSPYLSSWSPSPSFNGTNTFRYYKALGQTLVKQKESLLWDRHVQCSLTWFVPPGGSVPLPVCHCKGCSRYHEGWPHWLKSG